ncbi:glycosyltransferase [Glaciecola petra]|uniref:Glycosyltransferase family A protein n=1 Tax=Glaciecola petra TaxID=3075602 RepID=A0ABU2ZMW2_9ALTE|nr:glycosyltransferase family A protein [Aestuariibacter sp. P117]MDT0593751.1 glycosyltransferase family A protein [Aestuariibacter sp. P117]
MNTHQLPMASIVIPAYGRTVLLEKAVRSCITQDYPATLFEVIVVDSSSNDANEKMVNALASESPCSIKCLRKKAEGPGPSRTLGAQSSKGEYIAFMDSDCEASPKWLRSGILAFGKNVGLVQGQTLPQPGAPHNVFNRSFELRQESFIYETVNIFYSREAFMKVGSFRADEDPENLVVMGGEDTDFAWKVKNLGYASKFSSDATVYHVVDVISPTQWLFDKRMMVVPRIPKDFPQTRKFFYLRYFFDQVQATYCLGLIGLIGVLFSWFSLLLFLPYCFVRGSEKTVAMKGLKRLFRIGFYFCKDSCNFFQLLRGSIKYRSLLL